MTTYPDDADGEVLAELASHGIDMSQPLEFEFFVAVPDEEAANQVADGLENAGFESQIEFDEGDVDFDTELDDGEEFGPAWTVYANVKMIPEYDEIIRIQSELDGIAKPFGGYADGWGVMVDNDEEE